MDISILQLQLLSLHSILEYTQWARILSLKLELVPNLLMSMLSNKRNKMNFRAEMNEPPPEDHGSTRPLVKTMLLAPCSLRSPYMRSAMSGRGIVFHFLWQSRAN